MVLTNRSEPICAVPRMRYGNKPTDGGFFILSDLEREEILHKEPRSAKFIRPYLGAEEVLEGSRRWCLWLVEIQPNELRHLVEISRRVEAVRQFRLKSKAQTTKKYADFPTLFRQIAQPKTPFIVIPGHSSETRRYVPFAHFSADFIVSNACFILPDATVYDFGVISSAMHMAWMRQTCGRLESRYRYSKDIVYNNYPWPDQPTVKQREAVQEAAQSVLDARNEFPNATLSDLYDPLAMPPALVKAHAELDRAVDLCYRPQPFQNDRQRVEYLFALYEKLTAPLITPAKKTSRRKK